MSEKRYRIEGSGPLRPLPVFVPVVSARAGTEPGRSEMEFGRDRPAASSGDVDRLAVELHAMRDAIATTKREMAAIQRSPSGTGGIHRAASELDAVSAATERAATTILGAVEEIEAAAHLLKATQGCALERNDPVAVILERVLVLYEACNFQDIAGQRIRKVLQTLHFVEARLDRVIAAWALEPRGRPEALPDDFGPGLLSGPKLPGDEGHVSQSDVDAYFG